MNKWQLLWTKNVIYQILQRLYYFIFILEQSFKHPEYDEQTVDNDIALLKIKHHKSSKGKGNFQWACLPKQDEELPKGHCTIMGWGKEKYEHHYGTYTLQEAEVISY